MVCVAVPRGRRKARCRGRDAKVDFRHGRGGTHMAEQRVAEAMVCNRMAFGQLSAREFGMGRRIPAEQEERRPHAFGLEGIEYGLVVPGHGPSSKVSATSLSARGRVVGKCLRPTRGVVAGSIASTREVPNASG